MFGFLKKKEIAFDKQLQKLSELGISLNQGIEPALLFDEFPEQEYLKNPYQLLMISMGGEIYKDNQFVNISNQIWHLDTECIEDHGDYTAIIERLKNLTGSQIHKINDYVDIENEIAWVSFEYENRQIKWDLKIDDDWIDPAIFDKFMQLIGNKANKKIVIATLGQDCLVAYLNEEQLKEVNKLVKYKFHL